MPLTTGYAFHTNLYVGDFEKAYGSLKECDHCKKAMQAISVEYERDALSFELARASARPT
ncbi:MAG: hypothetical protein HQ513_05250 [Rhodospirillales bacterium]|nr:hypothetical protein [Rhodospirillales bacterium]